MIEVLKEDLKDFLKEMEGMTEDWKKSVNHFKKPRKTRKKSNKSKNWKTEVETMTKTLTEGILEVEKVSK